MDTDTSSDIDESTSAGESNELGDPGNNSASHPQLSSDSDFSDTSEITGLGTGGASGAPGEASTSVSSSNPTGFVQGRARPWRLHRLRGGQNRFVTLSSLREGSRIRDLIRRPRCGLRLLRSVRSDAHLSVPEARSDPRRPPRQPGRVDKFFCPKDGDLLFRHVKKVGKRVLEFFDPENPVRFEDGDYLLRFKVDNYSLMHQTFVTARGYLHHHGHWVYLGKDSDQMDSHQ